MRVGHRVHWRERLMSAVASGSWTSYLGDAAVGTPCSMLRRGRVRRGEVGDHASSVGGVSVLWVPSPLPKKTRVNRGRSVGRGPVTCTNGQETRLAVNSTWNNNSKDDQTMFAQKRKINMMSMLIGGQSSETQVRALKPSVRHRIATKCTMFSY